MNISENGAVGDAITVHDISEKILEQTVHFHVMKFNVFLSFGSARTQSCPTWLFQWKYICE
jgi:hypothetical protein